MTRISAERLEELFTAPWGVTTPEIKELANNYSPPPAKRCNWYQQFRVESGSTQRYSNDNRCTLDQHDDDTPHQASSYWTNGMVATNG